MPVRWTPEKDQLLLLKILETHNLSVDTRKVAEAWREVLPVLQDPNLSTTRALHPHPLSSVN
ncbi:hypothetical protein BJX63DRAFT_432927 [Aspergillus granulosus]|uniref:Uncharacterized protein n=1 Tax=Aspergillus granulosus TaxID=176169 RepID=A0ABR4H9J1_9EURO